MRIALIVPNGRKDMGGMGDVARPPAGACCLKSYLMAHGHEARVFHQIDESYEELVDMVLKYGPDIIGFSVMSCVSQAGTKLAEMLKNRLPEVITVFGGDHVTAIYADHIHYGSSLMSQFLSDNPIIDALIPFEGELALTGLADGLSRGNPLEEIQGLAFEKAGKLCITPTHPRISDLDSLPIANRSDLPYGKYHSVDEPDNLEYLHTSRGCKYRCAYCATPVANPGPVAQNSALRVFQEMLMLYQQGRRAFFFADELFTADPARLHALCKLIINSDMRGQIGFRAFARVDDVTRERIDLRVMHEAGLNGLFFGVESMNRETLKRLGKGTNPDQVETAFRLTKDASVNVWGSLMMGYPWEDERALQSSLGQYLTLVRDDLVYHTYAAFITPFPGTRFFQECRVNKWLGVDMPTLFASDCSRPVLHTPIRHKTLIDIYDDFVSQI